MDPKNSFIKGLHCIFHEVKNLLKMQFLLMHVLLIRSVSSPSIKNTHKIGFLGGEKNSNIDNLYSRAFLLNY